MRLFFNFILQETNFLTLRVVSYYLIVKQGFTKCKSL